MLLLISLLISLEFNMLLYIFLYYFNKNYSTHLRYVKKIFVALFYRFTWSITLIILLLNHY